MRKVFTFLMGLFTLAAPVSATLKVGEVVPDFSAPLSDGTTFHLSEWLAKAPLVLYFYPKDDTPGCTTEACGLRDDFSAFRDLKATVIGVSYDSVESHKKFIAKYKLPFPLIADESHAVAKIFGVDGKLFANRATFVIDRNGHVVFCIPSVVPKTHSQELRDALKNLK